jgi:hypothetical protein
VKYHENWMLIFGLYVVSYAYIVKNRPKFGRTANSQNLSLLTSHEFKSLRWKLKAGRITMFSKTSANDQMKIKIK